ncbi:MAG TPA: hypothetical protein PLU22_02300 [Polyangiaceae bacterium]|nr:hypothetical protein [Polyangiaceae bacterium]
MPQEAKKPVITAPSSRPDQRAPTERESPLPIDRAQPRTPTSTRPVVLPNI